MRVKCDALFPGEIVQAVLVESASQTSHSASDVRLELPFGGAPIQLPPPSAFGAIIVEATDQELSALERAGYQLKKE